MDDFVKVPRALLLQVLETAQNNSVAVEGEWSTGLRTDEEFKAERDQIAELRRFAEEE